MAEAGADRAMDKADRSIDGVDRFADPADAPSDSGNRAQAQAKTAGK